MEELKIALKVNDLDNVATIFANDVTDGTVVEMRDKKGNREQITVKGDVPYVHNLASMRGRGDWETEKEAETV